MSGRRDAAPMIFSALGLALLWGLVLGAPGGVLPAALLLLPAQLLVPWPRSPSWGPPLGAALLALGGAGALASADQLTEGLAWGGALLALQGWHRAQGARLAALERASHRDALTGAFNRHRLPHLEAALGAKGGVLIYLDIDGFKALNRARGQGAGDRALRRLTEILGAVPVVRMGGDEFLVFYGETALGKTGRGAAGTGTAEVYLQAVLRLLTEEGLSFCAGLAPFEGPLATALAQAEDALRQAKARGPGQLRWGDGAR
jgi:diguanylate cyclase (GGDEF)-like protein